MLFSAGKWKQNFSEHQNCIHILLDILLVHYRNPAELCGQVNRGGKWLTQLNDSTISINSWMWSRYPSFIFWPPRIEYILPTPFKIMSFPMRKSLSNGRHAQTWKMLKGMAMIPLTIWKKYKSRVRIAAWSLGCKDQSVVVVRLESGIPGSNPCFAMEVWWVTLGLSLTHNIT